MRNIKYVFVFRRVCFCNDNDVKQMLNKLDFNIMNYDIPITSGKLLTKQQKHSNVYILLCA